MYQCVEWVWNLTTSNFCFVGTLFIASTHSEALEAEHSGVKNIAPFVFSPFNATKAFILYVRNRSIDSLNNSLMRKRHASDSLDRSGFGVFVYSRVTRWIRLIR